jgi:RNase H-fold protein (predicted Holliday junction resolvase)
VLIGSFIAYSVDMKFVELRPFIKQVLSSRTHGKILSLDVGRKHVGLALSDESKQFVSPAITLGRASLASAMQELVNKEKVCGVVVGIPLLDGKPTPFCTDIVNLMLSMQVLTSDSDPLSPLLGADCLSHPQNAGNRILPEAHDQTLSARARQLMPFTLWDEQFSTMEARRFVAQSTSKRSIYLKHKDSMAAAVILQKFLVFAEAEHVKEKTNGS